MGREEKVGQGRKGRDRKKDGAEELREEGGEARAGVSGRAGAGEVRIIAAGAARHWRFGWALLFP